MRSVGEGTYLKTGLRYRNLGFRSHDVRFSVEGFSFKVRK
jgi:hypothetical protein